MRGVKRSPWLSGLGVLLAVLVVLGGHARADVTSDATGTVIIYPKVVADGTRDTLIQLSNTTNMLVFVHCFYVNTFGTCSASSFQTCREDAECPDTETCVRACDSQNDWDMILTAQQPTMWRASTGRSASQSPPCRLGQSCSCTINPVNGQLQCPGLQAAPANATFVPPAGSPFEGELKCIQMTSTGEPFAGNALKGEATLETISSGQVSEYNALAISANGSPSGGLNSDNDLLLNFPRASDGTGELNACPRSLVFTTYAEGATDLFSNATVSTEITLVPCTELLELGAPTPANVSFVAFDEMEMRLSADGIPFDCYFSRRLRDIPTTGANAFGVTTNREFLKIRVTPSSSNRCLTGDNAGGLCTTDADCLNFLTTDAGNSLGCRPTTGVLGVAEEFYSLPGRPDGTAAINSHMEGRRDDVSIGGQLRSPDIIVLP